MRKYTTGERLEIGRRIYEKELNLQEAADAYNISTYIADACMILYRDSLPKPKDENKDSADTGKKKRVHSYETMSRNGLIDTVLSYKFTETYEKILSDKRSHGEFPLKESHECEFEVIDELSNQFERERLCKYANVTPKEFSGWKRRHRH
jgi:hypothetical protein